MARVPLYKAAETEMIRRIESGEWAPGLRLPNEFGLADEFGVSQGTMRRALITLEGMGLLHRKAGRGTLVADPASAAKAKGTASIGTDRLTGPDGAPPVLEAFRTHAKTRGADAAETDIFGTMRLSELERTLRLDGDRVALDTVTVPEALALAIPEDAPIALEALLADLGHPPARIEDHLTAAVTSMGQSVALSVDRHTGLLMLTRTAYDVDDTVLARQSLAIVTDRLAYSLSILL